MAGKRFHEIFHHSVNLIIFTTPDEIENSRFIFQEVDLGVATFMQTYSRGQVVDFLPPYIYTTSSMLYRPSPAINWDVFLKPFTPILWLAVFGGITLMVVLVWFFLMAKSFLRSTSVASTKMCVNVMKAVHHVGRPVVTQGKFCLQCLYLF